MRAQKDAQVLKDAGEIQDEQNSTPNFLTIIFRRLNILTLICFSPDRKISDRALEDRQTQVKDYYNFAVQMSSSSFTEAT